MNSVRPLYTTALRLATPALLAHLARRTRRQTGTPDDWRARLGLGVADRRRPVWLHAASAGETQAAAPLALALQGDYPLRITSFTASGRARAESLMPGLPVELAPLDLPGAWRRFLVRTRPRLAVLLETELWPNLIAAARREGLPVVLASARLTPASARRMASVPTTVREILAGLVQVLAQTPEDLERFIALGLPPERGRVTGNLKEALVLPAREIERGRRLKASVFAKRPVWIAGSLREGEEAAIAEAAVRVRAAVPEAIAILVPRHPERAGAFASELRVRGVAALQWDSLDNPAPVVGGDVVLVAQVGVLLALYAAADVAFVGGTLAPLGGHNLLEPARLGLPVIAGPSLSQVRRAAERLRAARALIVVRDGETLAAEVIALLRDPPTARAQGEEARRAVETSEVLATTLAALRPYL